MSKINKTQVENLKTFINSSKEDGFVLKASDWTTGRGRYTTTKALPPFVKEFRREDFDYKTAESKYSSKPTVYPTNKLGGGLEYGTPERKAGDYFIKNSRVQRVLVLDLNQMIEALHGIEL